ncbi:hypothetical protein Tco_0129430, partial [Tanacetum coccineum]
MEQQDLSLVGETQLMIVMKLEGHGMHFEELMVLYVRVGSSMHFDIVLDNE